MSDDTPTKHTAVIPNCAVRIENKTSETVYATVAVYDGNNKLIRVYKPEPTDVIGASLDFIQQSAAASGTITPGPVQPQDDTNQSLIQFSPGCTATAQNKDSYFTVPIGDIPKDGVVVCSISSNATLFGPSQSQQNWSVAKYGGKDWTSLSGDSDSTHVWTISVASAKISVAVYIITGLLIVLLVIWLIMAIVALVRQHMSKDSKPKHRAGSLR